MRQTESIEKLYLDFDGFRLGHSEMRYERTSRTLQGLHNLQMEMGGLCDSGRHEPRFVDPDTETLICKYGPDAITEDVMKKITCRDCGEPVAMIISATSARANAPGTAKGGR